MCLLHSIGNGLWLISDQKEREREREEKGRRKLRDTKFFVIQEILGSHVSDRVYVGIKLPRESLSLSLSLSLSSLSLPLSLFTHTRLSRLISRAFVRSASIVSRFRFTLTDRGRKFFFSFFLLFSFYFLSNEKSLSSFLGL